MKAGNNIFLYFIFKDLTSEESPEINLDALFDSVARQYGSLVGTNSFYAVACGWSRE